MNITLYGKTNCTFCKKAVGLLLEIGLHYNYIDISSYSDIQKEQLRREFNMKTVPIIVINGVCIGGYTELLERHKRGELQQGERVSV